MYQVKVLNETDLSMHTIEEFQNLPMAIDRFAIAVKAKAYDVVTICHNNAPFITAELWKLGSVKND